MKRCFICGMKLDPEWKYEACARCSEASDHERIIAVAERLHGLGIDVEVTQPFVEPDGLYDERLRLATEKAERLERWLRFIEGFDLYEFGGHIGAARAALEGKPAPRW